MKRLSLLLLILITSAVSLMAQDNPQKLNLPNGWNRFTINGIYYDVEIQDGRIHGKGNVTWPDGSSYSGAWNNNQISGPGTYKWSNGDRYEGSFRNNKRHGYGTMYWNDGSKYGGVWKEDKRHGKGRMWHTDGKFEKGLWADNQYLGPKKKKSDDTRENVATK
ncbi:MAG: hypothetical protein AAFX87_01500 [Bacteroidota bacterium]